jgi:hypothetical protein
MVALNLDGVPQTTSEMVLMLNHAIGKKREMNPSWQPPPVMQKTLENAIHFGKLKNKESMEAVRQ